MNLNPEIVAYDDKQVIIRQSLHRSDVAREFTIPFGAAIPCRTGVPATLMSVTDTHLLLAGHRPLRVASLFANFFIDTWQTQGPSTQRRSPAPSPAAMVVALPEINRDPLAGLHRDLDVADDVGLKNRHRIRDHIRAMAESGAIHVLLPGENIDETIRPCAVLVMEMVSMPRGGSKEASSYYLTDAARRAVVLRLNTPAAKDIREQVHERVAQPPPAPPALDVQALGTVIASSVAAALAPLFAPLLDRLATPPQLPAGSVVVPPVEDGYEFSQARAARRLGLPESGDGSNLIGGWARELRMHGVAPWSVWCKIGVPGHLVDDGQVRYSADALERFEPMAHAALEAMKKCGYRILSAKLSAFGLKPTSKSECARQMRDAGLAAAVAA